MDPLSLMPGPDLGESVSLPLCADECTSGVVDAGKEWERKKNYIIKVQIPGRAGQPGKVPESGLY